MNADLSHWFGLEKFVGHKVPLFLKLILWKCGYDNIISLKYISMDSIEKLEKYIQDNNTKLFPEILEKLVEFHDCDDTITIYKEQSNFQFLPGHRSTLSSLPDIIKKKQTKLLNFQSNENVTDDCDRMTLEYSTIMKELIQSAKTNSNKSKHAYTYSDIIKYFSTYIFLLCGRTCYETLNRNLPIPSTKTICKDN